MSGSFTERTHVPHVAALAARIRRVAHGILSSLAQASQVKGGV